MLHNPRHLMIALLIAAASCGPPPGTSASPQHNVVTAAELAPMTNVDLYTALQRVRPTWFISRNRTNMCNPCDAAATSSGNVGSSRAGNEVPVHLFVNGQRTEGLESLRLISVASVVQVRFYEPQDANTHFGTGNNGGAIDVTVKP